MGYDRFGRKSSETDQARRTRWFDYDSAGRLAAVILTDVNDPYDNNTPTYPRYEYKYDKYGNLTEIWDNVKENPQTGNVDYTYKRVTKFTYNHLNKMTSRTLPDGRTEYKEYNTLGQLIKTTDFIGHVTIFTYDDSNAPALLHYQKFYDSNDLIGGEPNLTFHFNYDELGRKTQVDVNDEGTSSVYQYWYNDEGRVYRTFSPQGYVNYEFSEITGRRTSVYTPKDNVDTEIDYCYDELGRLKQVKVDQRNSQDVDENIYYTYNEVGSLATVAYPNNVTTYTYNDLNRLTNMSITDGSNNVIVSYEYTLAADGQRTSAKEVVDGSTTTIAWKYDALNRLTKEVYDANGDSNDFTHTYVYDLVGNRLEKQVYGGSTTYYYYDPNTDELYQEITDSNNIYYYYDDNGSLIIVEKDNDANLDYYYDLRGRLSRVEVENGSTVDYKYSPAGIRVRATVDGNDIEYLIDQYNHTGFAQVFKEIDTAEDANTIYVLGHDVLAQAKGAEPPKYMLYDGHGSVRQLADSAGNITASYAYDAYGNAHGFMPSDAATKLLYAGEMYDSIASQYYLRARWYSPITGRFNRMDPFAGNNRDPQSLHKYLYAHCNPVNNIDPSGYMSIIEFCVTHSTQILLFLKVASITLNIRASAKGLLNSYIALRNGHVLESVLFAIQAGVHGAFAIMEAFAPVPPGTGGALALAGAGEKGVQISIRNPLIQAWIFTAVRNIGAMGLALFSSTLEPSERGGSGGGSGSSGSNRFIEKDLYGSKKHGLGWTEGPARAIETGNPQGQFGRIKDLKWLLEKAKTIATNSTRVLTDLPSGHTMFVHMPDGTTVPATKVFIKIYPNGKVHGYPMP